MFNKKGFFVSSPVLKTSSKTESGDGIVAKANDSNCYRFTQSAFTCSKLTIETLA